MDRASSTGSKRSNMCIIRVPGGEEGGERKSILRSNGWNLPNLAKDMNLHVQEAEKTPNRINPRKFMPKHIITTFLKIKDKEKKSWKQPARNDTLPAGELWFQWQQTSHLKPKPEHSGMIYFKCQEKKIKIKPWILDAVRLHSSGMKRKWKSHTKKN